jgi:micrococcal nuclease
MAKRLYENCRIEKIVDGDTVDVAVDLGFHVWTKVRVRLAGINAPETFTPEGLASKSQLAALCSGAEVKMYCEGKDRYGRWIAGLIRKTDDLDINDEMIRLGCAVAVKY